jgi:predicted hotdog family 3-hydroxylacyl-ACP dehydratase
MTSLRAACRQGGSIALLGSVDDDKVRYRISVKGEALDLSTDAWMATGMGFWFARQVLAAHGGGLREPTGTLSDRSAEWSFVLPRAG